VSRTLDEAHRVGDTLSLLMADRAFTSATAAVAKLGVLAGSTLAGTIGLGILYHLPRAATLARDERAD